VDAGVVLSVRNACPLEEVLPSATVRGAPGGDSTCERRGGRCHRAVLLKWGRSTLAFFPMQSTHSGVCGRGILTRHWAFDGSEARHILRGSMHNAQMCDISLQRGADTSVSANRLAPFSPQWSNGTHATPCMADETGDETRCPTLLWESGQFLLQFAVEEEDLAVALPAAPVVNVVERRCT